MITFKQSGDLDKLPATDPAYATVKEIISPHIDDPRDESIYISVV